MQIGRFDLQKDVMVVAEIGNNHEGKFEVAQELVREAAKSKVDAVKFQTFQTESYIHSSETERYKRLKSFELTADQFRQLKELAHSLNLLFLSTPFDLKSVDVLDPLVDAFKVSSGDLVFYPLISRICQSDKPIIFSTGASDQSIIENTMHFVQKSLPSWKERIALLHCVSSYPVPTGQANLLAIPWLSNHFSCTIGYSDHTIGTEASVLAVALGARIVEKHFTLDKHYSSFRDHQLSADPLEMTKLVSEIRTVPQMLGRSEKVIQPCEKEGLLGIRRSIVSNRDLSQGTVLQMADLRWTRPSGGIPPGEESRLLGKTLKNAISAGHVFTIHDVE